MPEELQKLYHPDGTLQNEIRLVNGVPHGLRRGWHPNGVLAAEVPFENGFQHGICRFWNKLGQLLGQYQMTHGSGYVTGWFENGNVKSVSHFKRGAPHGRVRAWAEDGELVSESYWVEGRQVTKRRYHDSCVTDESLPRYEEEARPISAACERPRQHTQTTAPSEDERRAHNDAVERLLKSEHCEALAWLRGSSDSLMRTLGQLATTAASIRLIEETYAAGAKEVLAVQIAPALEGKQSTDKLLIAMPRQPEARQRLLGWYNEQAELDGHDPDSDWGQEYLLSWFD